MPLPGAPDGKRGADRQPDQADDDLQTDANISPDGRFVVFVSKYNLASNPPSPEQATPYVIELPPGWFSTTNSSTP